MVSKLRIIWKQTVSLDGDEGMFGGGDKATKKGAGSSKAKRGAGDVKKKEKKPEKPKEAKRPTIGSGLFGDDAAADDEFGSEDEFEQKSKAALKFLGD